jgi:hypothetical protein
LTEEEPGTRSGQALAKVRMVVLKAEKSTQKALGVAAPRVSRTLDRSMETASKSFLKTVKYIDGATTADQVRLFKVYRRSDGFRRVPHQGARRQEVR